MILYFMLFLSLLFMILNHPLALGGVLLLQTILVSILSGFMFINFWLSYILFLIMVGGMMIMFMYMTSIASNEKFLMPKFSIMTIFLLIFLSMLLLFLDQSFMHKTSNLMNSDQMKNLFVSLNNFFNFPKFNMLIFLMSYLLLTLIAVVKITGKKMKPMRQN
uniref:NADH-ubiquinone oxidoreductase chain 6 n=1 Tax=Scolytinae sp. BMNH 1043031 TaxID=1903795 RepID=A0A343A5A3_9CUCU|nr:NADH dehydrogenase subunit 6 [Scolytinae sp. BMNH 1043031]